MSESLQSTGQTESESQSADADEGSPSESDTEYPITREQQMVFGDDGEIEPDGDSVETSLEAFGAEVDHSDGSAHVAEPKATRFGIDDRIETSNHQRTESDQHSLFADVEDDQQTLGGDDAATRCLFGDDDDGGADSASGEEKEA
jgi:hypothetical protein